MAKHVSEPKWMVNGQDLCQLYTGNVLEFGNGYECYHRYGKGEYRYYSCEKGVHKGRRYHVHPDGETIDQFMLRHNLDLLFDSNDCPYFDIEE